MHEKPNVITWLASGREQYSPHAVGSLAMEAPKVRLLRTSRVGWPLKNEGTFCGYKNKGMSDATI